MNLKTSKVGRNDPCPCCSGLKYKKCCAGKEGAVLPTDLQEVYARKYGIRVKTPKDIDAIRRAGRLVVGVQWRRGPWQPPTPRLRSGR